MRASPSLRPKGAELVALLLTPGQAAQPSLLVRGAVAAGLWGGTAGGPGPDFESRFVASAVS